MGEHTARISWRRDGQAFTDRRYSRAHQWSFDGGAQVTASSSPQVVPAPLSDATAVDPEEAFVAALSSCHMLWFLDLAARAGLRVDDYEDQAIGVLGPDQDGHPAMTQVTLHPQVTFSPPYPSAEQYAALHEEAHDRCFIARSVKTTVRCMPLYRTTDAAAE